MREPTLDELVEDVELWIKDLFDETQREDWIDATGAGDASDDETIRCLRQNIRQLQGVIEQCVYESQAFVDPWLRLRCG